MNKQVVSATPLNWMKSSAMLSSNDTSNKLVPAEKVSVIRDGLTYSYEEIALEAEGATLL